VPAGGDYVLAAGAARTIGEWIRQKAERNGDRIALEILGRERSYAALDEGTDRIAAGLGELGLSKGDKVCVMMRNSLENVDVWLGLCKAGVVEVPINTANRGYLLRYLIGHSNARAIVIDEEFLDRLTEVVDDLPQLEHVVVRRSTDSAGTGLPARLACHDLAALYHHGTVAHPTLSRSDTAVILYTSGTTGPSKGVVLSHEANLHLARHTCWLMDYRPPDVLYTVFPLFHINAKYTSVMAAMEADAKLVMDEQFSASRFWDICRRKGVTAFNYQGALLLMLFKQPERPDDADNPVRVGFGAPCPVDIWHQFETRFDVKLTEVYGSTEIAIATENRLDSFRLGSAGRESAGYELRVVDADDRPLPPNTAGEIVVRPRKPSIMIDEYYRMPAETLAAYRNLWFHTGDRGRLDEDGYLYFIDRMKDCIRRRGENVSSWEVEKVVDAHPHVLESAAFGVASDLTEEEVMIAVVVRPGRTLTAEELTAYCRTQLAAFAVPRFVRFVTALPKTPSQRIQKFKLREEGRTGDTWDRHVAEGARA